MEPDTKTTLTLIVSIMAIVVSGVAACFSILTYRRNRRLENENHLFKLKVDAYAKILSELNSLVNNIQRHVNSARSVLSNQNIKNRDEDKIDDSADEVDDLCFKFDDTIVANSLIMPENIISVLENISDKIMNGETVDSLSENPKETLKKLDEVLNELISDGNNLNDLMRKDLKIAELNLSLYKRIDK